MRTTILALTLLATTAMSVSVAAEERAIAMVPMLLPPPVEALAAVASASPKASGIAEVTVPVLKQPVQKGETITADNVTTQSIPASQAFASTITSVDELIGQQAIRPLNAGLPVNRLHVRVAPLVSRNQQVNFVYRRGGIELSGTGQAMEDGQAGQSIRVMNAATRSTVTGTVAKSGQVEIN